MRLYIADIQKDHAANDYKTLFDKAAKSILIFHQHGNFWVIS